MVANKMRFFLFFVLIEGIDGIVEGLKLIKSFLLSLFFLLFLSTMFCSAADKEEFDQYGGYKGLSFPAKSIFYTTKYNKHWWLVTPEGHPFFMLAVGAVNLSSDEDLEGLFYRDHVKEKYITSPKETDGLDDNWRDRWGYYVRERLRIWGFNQLGTFSYPPVSASIRNKKFIPPKIGTLSQNQLPMLITNRAGANAMHSKKKWKIKNIFAANFKKGNGGRFPDVFDPKFKMCQMEAAEKIPLGSPWITFVFMDQTDEMRGVNKQHPHLGFIAMAADAHQNKDPFGLRGPIVYEDSKLYTKYALRDFLKKRYVDLKKLNKAWETRYTSWDSNGGWGIGNGVLDENGKNLGKYWFCNRAIGKTKAQYKDLDDFAELLMRKWYKDVYTSFKEKLPYLIATNNLNTPRDYVYRSLKDPVSSKVYADIVVVQNDDKAGYWSDFLNRPFHSWNMLGYLTAENDSPLGFTCSITHIETNDIFKTLTLNFKGCKIPWGIDKRFSPVHDTLLQFSGLPPTISRENRNLPQYYRAKKRDWLSENSVRIREYGYFHGTYSELKKHVKIGDTFQRVNYMNKQGPFLTQEERGKAYAQQLEETLQEKSPNGDFFRIGIHIWQWKDNTPFYWEVYNFGLVTALDNAYDGRQACDKSIIDEFGFRTLPETVSPHLNSSCFGNYLAPVTQANKTVYQTRLQQN
nr:hypothetical protein [uncultured Desulfobacter sp.]